MSGASRSRSILYLQNSNWLRPSLTVSIAVWIQINYLSFLVRRREKDVKGDGDGARGRFNRAVNSAREGGTRGHQPPRKPGLGPVLSPSLASRGRLVKARLVPER